MWSRLLKSKMVLGGLSIIDFDCAVEGSDSQISTLRVVLHRGDITVIISKFRRLLIKLERLFLGVRNVQVLIHHIFLILMVSTFLKIYI